ncbi:MgtC/SapB family protein, partial [Hungatella sp. SL.1.14]|uniref:MgtC/SapB family protein n=1 Tax=Hungatella sp. SL.1.14 TaxID=2963703 RepID=UPI0032E3A81E
MLGEYIKLDPSRVAAGVVTAIGFIGSGVILFKNNRVSGLTTSAGIWATVGVGMPEGAGMYLIGVITRA